MDDDGESRVDHWYHMTPVVIGGGRRDADVSASHSVYMYHTTSDNIFEVEQVHRYSINEMTLRHITLNFLYAPQTGET
jgi:hypothetical protein